MTMPNKWMNLEQAIEWYFKKGGKLEEEQKEAVERLDKLRKFQEEERKLELRENIDKRVMRTKADGEQQEMKVCNQCGKDFWAYAGSVLCNDCGKRGTELGYVTRSMSAYVTGPSYMTATTYAGVYGGGFGGIASNTYSPWAADRTQELQEQVEALTKELEEHKAKQLKLESGDNDVLITGRKFRKAEEDTSK